MKTLSRIGLFIAKQLPRGYSYITRFVAKRDPALCEYPINLKYIPGQIIYIDLREKFFAPFLKYGCFGFQEGEDRFFKKFLKSSDIVFDVGANIGYPTILFAHLIQPSGKVFAFEPSKRAFSFLKRTVSGINNIDLFNFAISDKTGNVSFYETNELLTSSVHKIKGVTPYTVETRTLDGMLNSCNFPDFVKIDVEGHEPAVLRGMKNIITSSKPPVIFFEALTKTALKESVDTIKSSSNDYEFYRIIRRTGNVAPINDPRGTNNYLALPRWASQRLNF